MMQLFLSTLGSSQINKHNLYSINNIPSTAGNIKRVLFPLHKDDTRDANYFVLH